MKHISKTTNYTPNPIVENHKRGGVLSMKKRRDAKAQSNQQRKGHESTCLLMLISMLLFFGCAGMAVIEYFSHN